MLKGYCSLSELCETEITDGTHQTPVYSDKGYIFLSSKNVTSGVIDWENIKYIPENLHNELYARIKPQKDDILLAKNGTTGVAALVDRDEVFDIYVSLALIRPDKNKVIPQYLLYAINSRKSQEFFKSNLKGIGVPNLHLTHIRETPIKVYSIEVQKQIIEELSCVDCLLKKYEKKLDILNTLVKSRFVEMFGSFPQNIITDTVTLGEISDMVSGGTPSSKHPEYYGGTMPFVSTPCLGNNYIDEKDAQNWLTELGIEKSSTHIIPPNSILYGARVGVGKSSINKCEMCTNQDILSFYNIDTKKYNLLFIKIVMDQYYDYMNENKRGATIKGVTSELVKGIKIPLVTIDLQNQFADFVTLTDKSKFAVQQSIDNLQTLKAKLMQDYFG